MATEFGSMKIRFESDGAVIDITDQDGYILASSTLLHYEAVGEVEQAALRFARERGWRLGDYCAHWDVGKDGLMNRGLQRIDAVVPNAA